MKTFLIICAFFVGAAIGSEYTRNSIERAAKLEGVVYRDKKTDVLHFFNPCDSTLNNNEK